MAEKRRCVMKANIAVIRGDGIGPEIVEEALKVLCKVGKLYNHTFTFTPVVAGGCAIDQYGEPLPQSSLQACLDSDSVLLGAVGGPKWDGLAGDLRPERALLGIRKELQLFANLRPARLFPALKKASPLKDQVTDRGIDFLIVRELTGGLYFGERGYEEQDGVLSAYDRLTYSEPEIERIGRVAFETARKRRKKLHSVDKANVIETSRLWRKTMHRLKEEYPDVEYHDILVDNTAMQLVKDPSQFDVLVTENMFGDILSDEASMLTGSIGLIPSASLGTGTRGMYEPIHGSAPDIAGTGKANPLGTILAAAMMLRLSFGLSKEADAVEAAVGAVIEDGWRTADLGGENPVSCSRMGSLVAEYLSER